MSLHFKTRTGQTPVDPSIVNELKLSHVNDMSELYEHERENIALGIAWTNSTKKNHTDYTVWIEIHKHMLCDIWKFAGKIRTSELQNPDYHLPFNIRPALLDLEKDLLTWLEHKTYSPNEMMAIFHEKLLTIHPFRDGNGRWARVVTEFVSAKEGFVIPNWGKNKIQNDDERRLKYIEAVKKARHDFHYQDLIEFMY